MTMISLRALLFFFNDTATTEIYTLSLHDALPISQRMLAAKSERDAVAGTLLFNAAHYALRPWPRSEEHTSELQSRLHLVCRLLLEKKKKRTKTRMSSVLASSRTRRLHPSVPLRRL